jgi:hypothetical protein
MKSADEATKNPTKFAYSKLRTKECPSQRAELFDNLPKLMRTEQFAEHFRYSKATIYDWRYRGKLRGVPDNLFLTLNRRLYIRTDVFLAWLASQNPNLDGVDSEAL